MRHIQDIVLSISDFTGYLFNLAFDSNSLRFCSTEIKLIKSELSSIDIRKDQELSGASIRENRSSGLFHRNPLPWTLEIIVCLSTNHEDVVMRLE
jgi:hypothetical protein